MTVQELIEELQKQNPLMEVMHCDLGKNSFKITSINQCGEATLATGETYVLLDCGFVYDGDLTNEN